MVGDDFPLSEEINHRHSVDKALNKVQKQERRADFTLYLRVVKKIYTNKIKKRVDFIEKCMYNVKQDFLIPLFTNYKENQKL